MQRPLIQKKEKILEGEFEVENWWRFIALTSNEKPLTQISPFVIEKTVKGCVGEVMNVTKLRSGSLMIECIYVLENNNWFDNWYLLSFIYTVTTRL